MAELPAADAIACPRCGAPPGKACYRSYPVMPANLRAAEVPILGWCQARHAAARGRTP